MKAIKGLEKSIQDLIIVFCLKGCERLLKGYWKVAEGFALQTIQQYLSNIQTDKCKAERLKVFSGNKIALYAREDGEDSEELIHGQIGEDGAHDSAERALPDEISEFWTFQVYFPL